MESSQLATGNQSYDTRRFGRPELLVNGLLVLMFGGLLFFFPALYGYMLMEDTPPEWFGFLTLMWGALLWGRSSFRRSRKRQWLGMLFCGAMAAFSFFVAGEEISWGQRIFGFTPPEYFLQRNVQMEVTLHNISSPWMQPRRMGALFMLIYGVGVPLLAWAIKPLGRLLYRLGIPVPSFGAATGFAVGAWLMSAPITATDDEVGEVFFAFSLTAVAAIAAHGMVRRRERVILKGAGVLLAASLLLSALCFMKPEHREQIFNVGHLQAGMGYEGRGMMLEAAREYEQLAEYWESHWELWIRVMTMYYEGGNMYKAEEIATRFLAVNKRQWRVYEILAEIGRRSGKKKTIEQVFRRILIDEPYNIYAKQALRALHGHRWMYEEYAAKEG